MAKNRNLDHGDVFPASWTDAIQEFISTLSANVVIEKATSSSVRIPAGAGSAQASIGVGGLWRYRSTDATASLPGATPGTYDIYVSATTNSFSNSPAPDTDNTDYNFALHVVAGGDPAPSGGGITQTRKVGELDYSGTDITEIRQLVAVGDHDHAYSHSSAGSDPLSFIDIAGQVILAGTAASRPAAAAGNAGKIHLATDTGAISRSNGSAWTTFTDATKQPLDATLTALAGVTVAADKLIYATGADAFTTTDLTAAARALLDDTNATAMRVTLGLVPGTDVQTQDATLTALAGVATAADKLIYATGSDAFATTDLTAFARTLLDDANAAAMRTTLGLDAVYQPLDATLSALAGVTVAADKLIYATGADAFSTTDITAFARTLLDDGAAATMRGTLGLVINTDVQAYDATLAAVAGVTTAADKLIYFTGVDAAAAATLTTFGRSLIDDADAAAGRATLDIASFFQGLDATLTALAGLATGANKLAYSTGTDTFSQTDLSAFARTLLDDADAGTARGTLGAQAQDATLDALAGVVIANNKMIYGTGVDAFTTTDLTAFARTLLDDADAATARTTLGAQPLDATLTALAGVTTAADKLIYATGADAFATTDLTSFARTLLDDTTAATARTTLGAAATSHTHVVADVTDIGANYAALSGATFTGGVAANQGLDVYNTFGVHSGGFIVYPGVTTVQFPADVWFLSWQDAHQRMMFGSGNGPTYFDAGSVADISYQFRYNGGTIGQIVTSSGSYQALSDETLKSIGGDADGAEILDGLAKLRVREFYFKADPDKEMQIGPSSQGFYGVFPKFELKHNKKKAGKKNDQGKVEPRLIAFADMVGVALAACKELAARELELRERIEALEK